MRITMKRSQITSISGTIQTSDGTSRCRFFPTTGKLFILDPSSSRYATPSEREAFRFEFFGKKSEVLDEFDRQAARGEVRTGTRVMASRFEKASPLVESAFC